VTAPFTLAQYLATMGSQYQVAVNLSASQVVRAGGTNPVTTLSADATARQNQEWIDRYYSDFNQSFSGRSRGSNQPD
jgi:hypothetical protein